MKDIDKMGAAESSKVLNELLDSSKLKKMVNEKLNSAEFQKLNDMLEAVEGMNLNEKEKSFIKWLSGWETDSVYSFISIVMKARAEG